jgi:hypothetical protein
MPQFRCTAPGCGVVRPRRLPPASCPDKSRCTWVVVADDRDTAPAPAVEPSPPSPSSPPPPVAPAAAATASSLAQDNPPATASSPLAAAAPSSAALPPLQLSIAGRAIHIDAPVTLGRNGDIAPEAFRADIGVSRLHCRLLQRDGQWVVLAVSAAATLLDDRLVPPGNAAVLAPGAHRLVLGDSFELGLWLAPPAPTPAGSEADAGGELDRLLRGGNL